MLVLAMEFSRDERAEENDAERVVRVDANSRSLKTEQRIAQPFDEPPREVETYDRDGASSSRIASDQLRSSLSKKRRRSRTP
jgi:hypothetical protein